MTTNKKALDRFANSMFDMCLKKLPPTRMPVLPGAQMREFHPMLKSRTNVRTPQK